MLELPLLTYPLAFARDVKYPVQKLSGVSAYGNISSYFVGQVIFSLPLDDIASTYLEGVEYLSWTSWYLLLKA
jgi:hypothetical protein